MRADHTKDANEANRCEGCDGLTDRVCRRCGRRICRACAKDHWNIDKLYNGTENLGRKKCVVTEKQA